MSMYEFDDKETKYSHVMYINGPLALKMFDCLKNLASYEKM